MWELLLNNADSVHLQNQILLVFFKIQNRPLGASCSFSGVERSYHYVGFVKIFYLRSHTVQQSQRSSF